MKYILVFHPTGQSSTVQIGSRPICASPLEYLEYSRTALAGRVAINLRTRFTKKSNQKKGDPKVYRLILNNKLPIQYRI